MGMAEEVPADIVDKEVGFDFAELFFSRTDKRGKILSGNTVFQRISGYSWSELIGKPHNIIRHPDVPRAVFWLLWDQIRKGCPVGAYVKNRAKDGRYYWVYAIVTPVDDGYLSVRLKPSGPLFKAVEAEYATLVAAEKEQQLKPEESAELLLARLNELGFKNYQSFMATTLLSEAGDRDKALQRATDPAIALFDELNSLSGKMLGTATAISGAFLNYQFVPLNLIVQASRLGDEGAAMSTISNNYSMLSEEIQAGLDSFFTSAREVSDAIDEGAFLIATSRFQHEMVSNFREETEASDIDLSTELKQLANQEARYFSRALDNLLNIQGRLKGFLQETANLQRLVAGLGAIRITGKVEAGHLGAEVLDDLIADLGAFQTTLIEGLSDILSVNHLLQNNVSSIVKLYHGTGSRGAAGARPAETELKIPA
jgi:PAS domain S-box-containing protein